MLLHALRVLCVDCYVLCALRAVLEFFFVVRYAHDAFVVRVCWVGCVLGELCALFFVVCVLRVSCVLRVLCALRVLCVLRCVLLHVFVCCAWGACVVCTVCVRLLYGVCAVCLVCCVRCVCCAC